MEGDGFCRFPKQQGRLLRLNECSRPFATALECILLLLSIPISVCSGFLAARTPDSFERSERTMLCEKVDLDNGRGEALAGIRAQQRAVLIRYDLVPVADVPLRSCQQTGSCGGREGGLVRNRMRKAAEGWA